MYELVVQAGFAAAHRLREYHGDCENLHGHNWKLEVVLTGSTLDKLGMLCDFRVIKQHLTAVTEKLDHKYLNELAEFSQRNPTTENVAEFVCRELDKLLPKDVRVARVTAWESEVCGATYISD